MHANDYDSLSVTEIMRRWPETIRVFIDLDLHCIGCPVGHLRSLLDAAVAHRVPYDLLMAELATAIAGARTRGARAPCRRLSSEDDEDP
jgi:hybrid cluster-associated redox disulfide protein